jgi:hypothetical protein
MDLGGKESEKKTQRKKIARKSDEIKKEMELPQLCFTFIDEHKSSYFLFYRSTMMIPENLLLNID